MSQSGGVEHFRFPATAGFIACCARAMAGALADRLPDLSRCLAIVPGLPLAPRLRAALADAAGGPVLLPRILTLPRLAAEAPASPPLPDCRRHVELFGALRSRRWLADAALWEVCAELLELFDELTEHAAALPETEEVLVARLAQAYDARASAPLRFEAQVVHRLWLAECAGAPGGAAARALALRAVAEAAAVPLFAVCDGEPTPQETAFWRAYARRQPVMVFLPDRALAGDAVARVLHAAWPRAEGLPPIERAAALADEQPCSPLGARLRLIGCASLEDEAATVAGEVRRWLAAGKRNIALVAADRVAARRARALLERDGILVRDETGWKLSTTRAAALVDAWLEFIAGDAGHRDALDLAKSPFVCGDWAQPVREAAQFALESGLARHNLACGLHRFETVLARDPECAAALPLLARWRRALACMPRGAARAAAWLDGLIAALGELGALERLQADAAGRVLLDLLQARREALRESPVPLAFGEWRVWLDGELERAAFVDDSIDSPVVMTALAALRLRAFEAAILIGADEGHLTPARRRAVFGSQAVRAELGLPTDAEARARRREDLACAVAGCGELSVTWRTLRGDEAGLLAGDLALLSLVHRCAYGDDLLRAPPPPAPPGVPGGAGTRRPAPVAPPERIPLRLSVSAFASLVACPYQFYARRVLGLAEGEEVREAMEKRDYGEIVHRILRRAHEDAPDGEAPEARCARIEALSREAFAGSIADNLLHHAWLARWLARVPAYAEWQGRREEAGWRFAVGEAVRECVLELEDGARLRLEGRLDRIDRRGAEEGVLDYKLQDARALRDKLAAPGEDVQLAAYALLQGAAVAEAAFLGLDDERCVAVALEEPQRAAHAQAARLAGMVARLRAGAGFPAHGAEAVCAWCEARGLCRRDYHAQEART